MDKDLAIISYMGRMFLMRTMIIISKDGRAIV
jgi:hypothetical protein